MQKLKYYIEYVRNEYYQQIKTLVILNEERFEKFPETDIRK